MPLRLEHSIDDTSLFLDNTGKEVNNLLVKNFGEFEAHFVDFLDTSGTVIVNQLADELDYNQIRDKVEFVRQEIDTLKQRILAECSNGSTCNNIEDRLKGSLEIENLPAQIDQEYLNSIASQINASIDQMRPDIRGKITETENKLKGYDTSIQETLASFNVTLHSAKSQIQDAEPYVEEYGDYVHYVGIGMCVAVLVVLCCYIFGLIITFWDANQCRNE